jgi:hypothetical protein
MVSYSISDMSVFVCYARADNCSEDKRLKWLDRLLEFMRPVTRFGEVKAWSDDSISPGGTLDSEIRYALDCARIAVLLVSPAFLASDYIACSEVPVLLMRAKLRGMRMLPVIISPCLYEETRFKYPDWRTGPEEVLLGSLQSINPPSRTLIEMAEGEQNRVLLAIARQIGTWLEEDRIHAERDAERAAEMTRQARLETLKRLTKEIEAASVHEPNKHRIVGEVCSVCGRSVVSIAHFKSYSCSRANKDQ